MGKSETARGLEGLEVAGAGPEAAPRSGAGPAVLAAKAGTMGRQGHARDIHLADILAAIRKDAAALETGSRLAHTVQANGSAAKVGPSRLQVSRIPTVAASAHVRTDAAERARRLQEERRRQRGPGQAAEDTEATVSFVVRSPRQN